MGTFFCDDRAEPMLDVDLAHLERTIVEMLLEHGGLVVTFVDGDGGRPVRYPIGPASRLRFEHESPVHVDEARLAIMRSAARDDAGLLAPRAA